MGPQVLQIQNQFEEIEAGRQCKGRQPRISSTRAPSGRTRPIVPDCFCFFDYPQTKGDGLLTISFHSYEPKTGRGPSMKDVLRERGVGPKADIVIELIKVMSICRQGVQKPQSFVGVLHGWTLA